MALDPNRPIDWEKLVKEGASMRTSFLLEMFRRGLIDGSPLHPGSIIYPQYGTGGGSIIDIEPDDYEIKDAPKELIGVGDVDATGPDKKS